MYSPRIAEDLIPVLYSTAKARRQPMTQLVDAFIRAGLAALTVTAQDGTAVLPNDNAVAAPAATEGGG